jgi:hypothetical protein
VKEANSLQFDSYGKIPFVLDSINPKISQASTSLRLDFSPIERGFHIRAARDISPGELVVVEKPFASVLISSNMATHCFECLIGLEPSRMSLSYCRQCTNVVYCSPECERRSWKESGHEFECHYVELLATESGLTHMEWLALKIVLKTKWNYLALRKCDLESYELKYNFSYLI